MEVTWCGSRKTHATEFPNNLRIFVLQMKTKFVLTSSRLQSKVHVEVIITLI